MPGLAVHNNTYNFKEGNVSVVWQSFDFSPDVAGIPDIFVRAVMLDSGVMYVAAATPKIRVSSLLDLELQGLSAVHEELCMEQKIDNCAEAEQKVIDSISDPQLRIRFISTRLRMFGALCILDGSNQKFATSRALLEANAVENSFE